MKTWEMIKKLTENPHKEFVRCDGLVVRINKYMELTWESGYSHLRIADEWQEVKKPVDFMTAVKSGKRVKVEHPLVNDTDNYALIDYTNISGFLYSLGNNFYSEDVRDIIQNGKFYIED